MGLFDMNENTSNPNNRKMQKRNHKKSTNVNYSEDLNDEDFLQINSQNKIAMETSDEDETENENDENFNFLNKKSKKHSYTEDDSVSDMPKEMQQRLKELNKKHLKMKRMR